MKSYIQPEVLLTSLAPQALILAGSPGNTDPGLYENVPTNEQW